MSLEMPNGNVSKSVFKPQVLSNTLKKTKQPGQTQLSRTKVTGRQPNRFYTPRTTTETRTNTYRQGSTYTTRERMTTQTPGSLTRQGKNALAGAGAAGVGAGAGGAIYRRKKVSKSFIPPRVPGGVGRYVPATQMGARRLRETVRPGMYKPAPMGEDRMAQTFRDQAPIRRMMMERGQAPQIEPFPVRRGTTPQGDGQTAVPVRPEGLFQRTMFGNHETPVSFAPGTAAPPTRYGKTNVSVNMRPDVTAGTGGIASRYGGRSGGVSTVVIPEGGAPGMSTANTLQHELAHATPNRSSWRMHQVINNPRKQGREEARADLASGLNHVRRAPDDHVSGYHVGARNRAQAAQMRGAGYGSPFFRGYRAQQNEQAGNTIPQRLFGNPRNRRDLAVGTGAAGVAGYEVNRRREGVEKSMSLEMPNGNVAKRIVRPLRPPATGTAPATPAPPKPTTGALRPLNANRPRRPQMPQAPTPGGSTR